MHPNKNPSKALQGSKLSLKLFVVLMRAAKTLQNLAADQINSCHLCPTDFAILEVLLHKGNLPISAIGSKVLLTNGAMTTAIDRLEEKGLVYRLSHATDRRTKLVALTNDGTSLIRDAFELHESAIHRTTAGLTDSEKKIFIGLSKKLGKFAETDALE